MYAEDDRTLDRYEQRNYLELPPKEKLTLLLTLVFNKLITCFSDGNLAWCKIDTVIIDKDDIRHCSLSNGLEVGTSFLYFDEEDQICSHYLPIDDMGSKMRNERYIIDLNKKHYQRFRAKLTHFFYSQTSDLERDIPLDALAEPQYIGAYDDNTLVFVVPIGYRELVSENSLLVVHRLFMTFVAILQMRMPNFQSIFSIPNYYKAADSILDYRATILDTCESILQWFICKKRYLCGNRDLYDTICSISSMPYEHRANTGTLAFASRASLASKKLMKFDKPLELATPNIREIRKLLETSKDNAVLLVDKGKIIGIMERSKNITGLQFSGTGNWTLLINNEPVIAFKQNNCFLVRKSEQVDVRALYRSNFPFGEGADNILSIIKLAEKQQHGTAIIISDGSEQEAERLCELHRGIKIQPLSLSDHPEFIGALTSIDGAVLIDQTGVCHAIGVILDGDAVVDDSTARGARYNSVKNYIERQKILMDDCHFIGVIISEDGSVDFLSTNDEMLKNSYWTIENG